jgi:predicted N-formylglutamate amidohydrolase
MSNVSEPFTSFNDGGSAPVLVLCDHASNAVPSWLPDLGISKDALSSHIGWDIGALMMAERIAERIDAPGVFSSYSRLVLDCNRPLAHAGLIPEVSDGTAIPGNIGLNKEQTGERIERVFLPYHFAIADKLAGFAARQIEPFVLSVHSCTHVMDNFQRPWSIGIAHSPDERVSRPLVGALENSGSFQVGDNEPYAVDESDYTVVAHGLERGLRHVLVEVRQDLIDDRKGAHLWADILFDALIELDLF